MAKAFTSFKCASVLFINVYKRFKKLFFLFCNEIYELLLGFSYQRLVFIGYFFENAGLSLLPKPICIHSRRS